MAKVLTSTEKKSLCCSLVPDNSTRTLVSAMNQWDRWAKDVRVDDENIYKMTNLRFATLLESFIATVRKQTNEKYSNKSLKSLTSNVVRERNLKLDNGESECDFHADAIFKSCRSIMHVMIKEGRRDGRGDVRKHDILNKNDVKYILKQLNENTPSGLLNMCLLGFHFTSGCRGGFSYRVQMSDLEWKENVETKEKFIHVHTKRGEKFQSDTEFKIFPSVTKKYCFYRLFTKMKEKFPKNNKSSKRVPDRLFLQPSRSRIKNWENTGVWYQRSPMGRNTISKRLKGMGILVKKSIVPHSLRKTNISTKQCAGIDSNVIAKSVGHSRPEQALPYTYITKEQEKNIQEVTDIVDSQELKETEKSNGKRKNEENNVNKEKKQRINDVNNDKNMQNNTDEEKKQRIHDALETALGNVTFNNTGTINITIQL